MRVDDNPGRKGRTVGHDLLLLAQPPDLVGCTEKPEAEAGADDGRSPEEKGDGPPSGECAGAVLGVLSDSVHGKVDDDTVASVGRLEDESSGRVLSSLVPKKRDR